MYTLVQKQNLEIVWRRIRQVCMSLADSPAKDRNALGRPQPGPDCSCLWAVRVLSCFSRVPLCATPWTGAHQLPRVHGTLQARILQWVAMPCSRGSSLPGDRTRVSYALHWLAGSLPLAPPGKPCLWPT